MPSIVFEGPEQVNAFAMISMRSGLALEGKTKGRMRMTGRAPKCTTLVRERFGITGNRATQYDKFNALCVAVGLPNSPRDGWDENGKHDQWRPVVEYDVFPSAE